MNLTEMKRSELLKVADDVRKELRQRSIDENGMSSISAHFCPECGCPLALTWKRANAAHYKCPKCTRHWFHCAGMWQRIKSITAWPPVAGRFDILDFEEE